MLSVASRNILSSIRSTARQQSSLGARMATGLSVATAKDDASRWSMARTLRSDRDMIEATRNTLAVAQVKTGVALNAATTMLNAYGGIQALLTAALEPGVDRAKIGTEIEALKSQMRDVIGASSVNGESWVVSQVPSNVTYQALPSYSLVSSYVRKSDGTGSLLTVNVKSKSTIMLSTDAVTGGRYSLLGYIYSFAQPGGGTIFYQLLGTITTAFPGTTREVKITASTPDYQIEDMISYLAKLKPNVENAAIELGLAAGHLERQGALNEHVIRGMNRQIATLVDDNLSQEAARMRALQVRQQLSASMLALANRSSHAVLLLTV